MKQKSVPGKAPADQVIKDIRRQTRRHYSAEEKIRIVLEELRGEENISELCLGMDNIRLQSRRGVYRAWPWRAARTGHWEPGGCS